MKKILFPVVCAMCVSPALAVNVKPYVGLNVGASYVDWDDDLQDTMDNIDVELAEGNITAGIDAGIRFANDNIWNGGIFISYDYLFDNEADEDNVHINEITTGFSMLSVGMDNYIRLGHAQKRNDLILGLGVAQVTERGKWDTDYFYDDGSDNGGAVVVKIGFNRQFSKNVDWYVMSKIFAPFNDKSDFDTIVTFTGGFKFHF